MISNLNFLDNFLILLYFALILVIGLFVSRNREIDKKQYFLAGKSFGWVLLASSLFVANLSSVQLIGVLGRESTIFEGSIILEIFAIILLMVLGFYLAPILLKSKVDTIPQFFGQRFDRKVRIYLSIISIFTYLFIKVGFTILAGGFVMQQLLGWDIFNSAILLVLLTGLYTMIGGMKSVVYTQLFQAALIILGISLLSIFSLNQPGELSSLSGVFNIEFSEISIALSSFKYEWIGLLIGIPIIGIWYWCSDQYVIQRVLSTKNLGDIKKGTLLASGFKFLALILLIISSITIANFPSSGGDTVYAAFFKSNFLPTGIKGILLVSLFAAIMSMLSSGFHATSTIFSLDIYHLLKPKATEAELVLIGRLATIFVVILTLSIVPLIKYTNTQFLVQLLAVQAYIAPPVVSILVLSIFMKNASSGGAIWALIIGGTIGVLKFTLGFVDLSNFESNFPLVILRDIGHLQFAIILFIMSSAAAVMLSYFSSKKHSISIQDAESKISGSSTVNSTISQLTQSNIKVKETNSGLIHK